MPWTKEIPHCALKFEAGEDNRILQESLSCGAWQTVSES